MNKKVYKPVKVALCRGCDGTGYQQVPQSDGSLHRVCCSLLRGQRSRVGELQAAA